MRRSIILFLLIALPFFVNSCGHAECTHEDLDGDSFCDMCYEPHEEEDDECYGKPPCEQHIDENRNARCDKCARKLDIDYVLTCGITQYPPMNYYDEEGKLVGFDTELATEVAKLLGMEVEFMEINWGSKYIELDERIDCVWNGFEANIEENIQNESIDRSEIVDFSYGYISISQCIVAHTDMAPEFANREALAGKTAAVVSGSFGELYVENLGNEYLLFESAIKALYAVLGGYADFACVDYNLAVRMLSGDFSNLSIMENIECDTRIYAVGFKKGSQLVEKVNDALKQLYENGKMLEIALKYDLGDCICIIEKIEDY